MEVSPSYDGRGAVLLRLLLCARMALSETGPQWIGRSSRWHPVSFTQNLYVLYSNDFVKPDSLELIKDIKAAGGTTIAEKYVVTDHSWSDHRIALESLVVDWLGALPDPR